MYTFHKIPLRRLRHFCNTPREAFTLIEVLIVVILLGILSALVIPTFGLSQDDAKISVFATNIKYACRAFSLYYAKNGAYPPDRNPAEMPVGMDQMLGGMNWAEETPLGGHWDWDQGVFGVTAGVSVKSPTFSTQKMADVDAYLDDGNLATGRFRARDGGYILVIRE